MQELTVWAGNSIYAVQAFVALVGTYCVIVIWRRLSAMRFRTEDQQNQFLDQLQGHLEMGDYESAAGFLEGDPRAVPQLALLGIANRNLGYQKVRELIAERFQRDVISELEHRLTWVFTAIKSAPMLGLLGTVLGMMAAFQKLSVPGQKVDPQHLAGDISLALITTFVGLSIAIPLSLCVSAIQIRMRKMEDLVTTGVNRFLEVFRATRAPVPEGVR